MLIGHLNKSSGTQSTYRGLGSIDIITAVRSLIFIGKVRKDPTTRVLIHEKSSLSATPSPATCRLPVHEIMKTDCESLATCNQTTYNEEKRGGDIYGKNSKCIHTLLHPTFQLAVRDDIIRKNPTDGVMVELKRNLGMKTGHRKITFQRRKQKPE